MTITDSSGVVQGAIPPGVPHLKIPFAIDRDGTAEVIQQGTAAEVVQCVANLVGTTPGTRMMMPAYGVPDPTFTGLNQKALQLAVGKYEDRAIVTVQVTVGNEESIVVDVQGGT
jgi:phage baseplate assembly protein W